MNNKDALFDPIGEKVFKIRGQYVMLDRDLAGLYGVETKHLNRQVKRNPERFEGDDYMFQLTQKEYSEILRCQIGTSRWGGQRYEPYAFTELGVSMLSSVLNSPLAIRVNRQIMRYFVYMRNLELNNNDFRKFVEAKLKLHDINFELIHSLLDSFQKRLVLPQKSTGKYGFLKSGEKKDENNLKNKKVR
ncbi:MAG: hypothetical protein A2452_03055 [Candidatus Firestonebacteria bacterium RIFOXYC2_FULL_39_67]|nr:MAG: hypothetical protein A2536_02470 [Candidatus Firestonebacteria bacterium RIFOXYD2_FULL_39_29]OGF55431.1 MAG: hypothetical protein A2452_03055 [Candidatus Firestonebacteria bacterium RIFOXYC2_FULL_39_67]